MLYWKKGILGCPFYLVFCCNNLVLKNQHAVAGFYKLLLDTWLERDHVSRPFFQPYINKDEAMSDISIGIDFGTTNTVIALADQKGAVKSVKFKHDDILHDVYRSLLCLQM